MTEPISAVLQPMHSPGAREGRGTRYRRNTIRSLCPSTCFSPTGFNANESTGYTVTRGLQAHLSVSPQGVCIPPGFIGHSRYKQDLAVRLESRKDAVNT